MKMSSCLYGGVQTSYGNDLDFIKFPSTSSTQTNHSSPSSTLSESSNSPLAICTRKPRTRRKRPNQTCNEAAALLSTAYPNIFPSDDVSKPCKFIKPNEYTSFSFEESSSELLLPFPDEKQASQVLDPIPFDKPCSTHIEDTNCHANSPNLCDGYEDFDTESILDEEIEEGVIDSIMGNNNNNSSAYPEEEHTNCYNSGGGHVNFCYGYPIGLGLGLWLGGRFDFAFDGMRGGVGNAIRQTDGDWWTFPTVNVGEISPKFNEITSPEKKKVSHKVVTKPPNSTLCKQNTSVPTSNSMSDKENSVQISKFSDGLLLKLNYDEVLSSWSDRGSAFSEDTASLEFSGSDVSEKLAQIDLFGEAGALREASVQRYKEKKRTRLFSKKIRYQVRKVNADQRPRMKGRFVRSNSSKERKKKAKMTS